MKQLWYSLSDFPTSVFVDYDKIVSDITQQHRSWICIIRDSASISNEVHQWLHYRGLKFSRCAIFYRNSIQDKNEPHVDIEKVETDGSIIFSSVGINLEMFGKGQVEFFDGNVSSGVYSVTPSGQSYISFSDSSCNNVVDRLSYKTNSPVIIRTDVIHRVECNVAPRMLVSIRFTRNGEKLSWDETVNLFSDSLILR